MEQDGGLVQVTTLTYGQSDNPWIQSPRPPELEDASIHSILITEERIWDMDTLGDIFNERGRG